MSTIAEQVRLLAEPILAELDLELFDVEYGGGSLTVTIDAPGGVGIDQLARATRAVSAALDDADPISGQYTLEVSSPGLERALRTPAHFAWAVGRAVSVKTVSSYDGPRRLAGTVAGADDDGVDLTLDEPVGTVVRLAYGDIDKARTTFEWGPAPKPGSASKPGKKKKSASAGSGAEVARRG